MALIYEEWGVTSGISRGMTRVCLSDTELRVSSVLFGLCKRHIARDQLLAVTWYPGWFRNEVVIRYRDSSQLINYVRFIPHHGQQWIAAFRELSIPATIDR